MKSPWQPIVSRLKGGDRRSIGKSNEIVAEVLDDPASFSELFGCLFDEDPVVRARAADAAEIAAVRAWVEGGGRNGHSPGERTGTLRHEPAG